MLAAVEARAPSRHLWRDRIAVIGIVFYVVAASAPLVGMSGAVPVAIGLGNGSGTPGAYLAVGIALLIFSVGYAAMSSKVTNAGAFFAYVGRGLGVRAGISSAFVSIFAYVTIQLAIYGFMGGLVAQEAKQYLGISLPWWGWVFIAWGLVLLLSLFSVDVGAKVLGGFMILELSSLLIMAFAVIFRGGGPQGLSVSASFAPSHVFVGGLAGSAGIALAFAFASYIGFEATAIYGEESRDPKRTVPVATYAAVGTIALLFAVTSWGIVSGLGQGRVVDETLKISTVGDTPLADPAQVIFHVATQYVGSWLADLMRILVISSLFAGLLAFQNANARYFYALGRAGVLPKALSHVSRRGSPMYGTLTMSGLTALVVLIFMAKGWDPVLNLFYWSSAIAVMAIVIVEILVSVAVIAFFRRDHSDTRLWNTVVAPILAIAALGIGLYLLMARFGLLAGTAAAGVDPTKTAWALSPTGWVLIALPFVMLIVGLVVALARRRSIDSQVVADLVS
ncbi:MAG: APC family permease [Acidothermus cellulolyticus]|nr:APC family permease [Acidothermus cellulolyticus]